MSKVNPGHKPSRFEVFTESKDGKTFTIKDTDHIFKFDRFGGWFDEYGNYYNADGSASDPPSDDDEHSDRSYSNGEDDYDDQFEKEFGRPKEYYDQDDEHHIDLKIKHYQKIAANMINLNSYPAKQPLRVDFRNVSYFVRRDEIYQFFSQRVNGITTLLVNKNQKQQFNGTGYFVVKDIQAAEELIKLEGENFKDREISFSVVPVEEFLLDPLQPFQLINDNAPKTKKYTDKQHINSNTNEKKQIKLGTNYVNKQQKQQESKKIEQKPQSKPVQSQIKVESPKKEQKTIDDSNTFYSYIFERKPFPKKSSFKEWMLQHHFVEHQDYKDVQKTEDKTKARIQMKKKIFNKLNNTSYNGEIVIFIQQH